MRLFILLFAFLFMTNTAFSSVNQEITADNTIQLLAEASQYNRITGKIISTDVDNKSKVIFLNFGNSYNTSLTALIYPNAFHEFEEVGIFDPAVFFQAKEVVIEGIIRISNGKPEIIIENPSQIRLAETKVVYTKRK